MKSIKLKSLILTTAIASTAIIPSLTSCNKSSVKVKDASIDTSKSHIEVGKDSTIYLIPKKDSQITGIKSVKVDDTVLNRMSYNFEYEQANGLAYKLTIYANCMKSVNISIEVHTSEIEMASVSYSGHTLMDSAALKPYTLEVKAKYKGETTETALTPGEFKVFDATGATEKDVTEQFISSDGYKMNVAQTYKIVAKSALDTSKTCSKEITITAPITEACMGEDYSPVDDHYCQVKMKDEAKALTGKVEIHRFFYVGGKEKEATAIYDSGFANSQAEQIEFVNGYSLAKIKAGVFAGCTHLKTINIPSSVSSIDTATFNPCTSLANVYIDSQAIVDLTNNDSGLFNASKVYVYKNLNVAATSFINTKYTKGSTVGNYIEWTKNP